MKRIIGPNNKVNYGVYDELVDFNYKDFRLMNFFGKEIKGIRKYLALHMFNYIGINAGDYFVGLAAVRLGYMHLVFAYVYDYNQGMLFEMDKKGPGKGKLIFPVNPDEYSINYSTAKDRLIFVKSHSRNTLALQACLDGRLEISLTAPYGLEQYQPLRVLNPSDPYRWTFTEKCSPIVPDTLEISLDGNKLDPGPAPTLLYDWSGGYLRRETNWYWAAFSSPLPGEDEEIVGANFAALTNESFFSENAFWVGKERTRVARCIYDFNQTDLYQPWRIWDEDGTVDLHFVPQADRGERINAFLIKSNFNQLFGTFSGKLHPKGGELVEFEGIRGLTEFHRAVW
ncbi:conserved hypothetical protein [Desulfatibacillum aliphaticivorans]|uniref:DUF2804 domain-containing protein n=1 Tax=Desulfatibacillum aliphaticivorans TaxID=218208 RepID=B8FNM7_DESAL|nr:DUF2804 domain-containing protein [Desulfatibacillum aliphaticivorans]ACL06308.1 conserved hypothetical protein [Desulfatibacillum aliphaticivorans]